MTLFAHVAGVPAEELALAASSHDGSDQHRAVAARLLAEAGAEGVPLRFDVRDPGAVEAAVPLTGKARNIAGALQARLHADVLQHLPA